MKTPPSRAPAAPPWALSFADLCILLLGFFVMLQATSTRKAEVVAGLHKAFNGDTRRTIEYDDLDPAALFQPGEAVFRAGARAMLATTARRAQQLDARIRIESIGSDRATNRFDGWELAAARTAAVARALHELGLAEQAIEISIPEMTAAGAGDRQRISIAILPTR